MADTTLVPARTIMTGTFLGFDRNTYDGKGGEKVEQLVVVLKGDSIRFNQAVKVAQGEEAVARRALDGLEGSVVAIEIGVSNFGAWFRGLA